MAAQGYPAPDVTGDPMQTVAITPAAATTRHAGLLAALAEAYPVRFTGTDDGRFAGASALIVFPGGARPHDMEVPSLALEAALRPSAPDAAFAVELARDPALHRALHGQRLTEHGRIPAPVAAGGRVLATAGGRPIWTRTGDHETAGAVPAELGEDEFLRDHLRAGRFWSLLPLAHFVRRVALGDVVQSGPHRACFVIDDPNVRGAAYGYVRFGDLAHDAREHGYHVAVATVPLDLLLPGRGAVGVFRSFPAQLSLVVHGNDHVHRELERRRDPAAAERTVAAATARVTRFEARAGIRVERVMCPPHGGCGPAVLDALFRGGYLGLAASRPFPWDAFADRRGWRLGGWLPAQMAGGGLPVLPRHPLAGGLDDLVLRAFLGQPLIVYCHHTDLRDGLGPFRAAAARIAGLGDVRFTSLAAIARGNAAWRDEGGVAVVTPYSRDLRIPRPPAETLRIEIPCTFGAAGSLRVSVDGTPHAVALGPHGAGSLTLANAVGGDLHVRIDPPGPLPAATPREWRPRAWPLARRAMTEARDRALPRIRRPR